MTCPSIRKIMCAVSTSADGSLYAEGSGNERYLILDYLVTPYMIGSTMEFTVLNKELAYTNIGMISEALNALPWKSKIEFSLHAAKACIEMRKDTNVEYNLRKLGFHLCLTLMVAGWGILRCLGFNTLGQTRLELFLYILLYVIIFSSFMIGISLRRDYSEFIDSLVEQLVAVESTL